MVQLRFEKVHLWCVGVSRGVLEPSKARLVTHFAFQFLGCN